jgi:hypothetical protein
MGHMAWRVASGRTMRLAKRKPIEIDTAVIIIVRICVTPMSIEPLENAISDRKPMLPAALTRGGGALHPARAGASRTTLR